jgi:rhamnosyltransferase
VTLEPLEGERTAIRPGPRRVSVVVPTWNGGPRFLQLLRALAVQDIEGGFELVVIDSGSRDGTVEAAQTAGANVLHVPQSEFNHGRTRNVAIAESFGELVALLTQDAVPLDATYLTRLAAAFDETDADGVYARQFPQHDCDPLLAERLRQWSASRSKRAIQELVAGDPDASRARFAELPPMERYLACAFDDVASAVRRSTWERHPLPERSFGEDVAWAREVLLDGGKVVFEPDARVEHSHRLNLRREFKRIYCDHRNLMELFELRNVPSWREVWRGWGWQLRFYRELLERQQLPAREHLRWRLVSIPHALLETTAQFLGARSHEKALPGSPWNWLDRRLRAQV